MPSSLAANDDARTGESTTPWPPRYRWLKRSLVIFATVAILLIGLHIWWNHIADQRLAAQIAAIHARGEPILPEDFPTINIADSDNAAWYLRQAAAAIKHGPEAQTLWNGWDIAYTDHEISDLTRWMDDEQNTRSMVRQARAHPIVAWNMKFGSPAIMTLLPDLSTQRSLANTLRVVSYVEHHRGNDAGAVEALRDLSFVADAMQQYLPTLVSHLVGIGIGAITSDAAINLSREMAIADESAATRPGGAPASRAQVFQLIADLSDERQYRLGGIRSLYGERTGALDSIKALPMQAMPSAGLNVFRPAFQLDVINMLRAETQVSLAMGQPTLASARALMPNIQPMHNRQGVSMLTHLLSSILTPSLNRFAVTHYRGLTDRRAAVIALAIRLWRFDHDGKWPASLDDLVPGYLAATPVDPMSPTAAPFHYKPDAPGGAIIYSVGECGTDHGGSEQLIHKISFGYTAGQWDKLNAVYHLTSQPLTTRPSSE
jgi:hypothetical protein